MDRNSRVPGVVMELRYVAVVAFTIAAIGPTRALAEPHPENGCTNASGYSFGGVVAAGASAGCRPTPETVPAGSAPSGPTCSWDLYLGTIAAIDHIGGVPAYRDASTKAKVDAPGPGVETMYRVSCPDGVTFRWASPAEFVDRAALIASARDDAIASIPVPSLEISPPAEMGGIVNLGLWLAIADPGQVNAYAEVGPVWASVTATFTGMTWDMGNGDIVECAGPGVPYPQGANTYEQGPCGYTYTEQPPPDGYTVTVTGHWHVQLFTSFGDNRALDPIDMPHAFPYDVDELVTVGVDPDA